jgi:hypothetical protein
VALRLARAGTACLVVHDGATGREHRLVAPAVTCAQLLFLLESSGDAALAPKAEPSGGGAPTLRGTSVHRAQLSAPGERAFAKTLR